MNKVCIDEIFVKNFFCSFNALPRIELQENRI